MSCKVRLKFSFSTQRLHKIYSLNLKIDSPISPRYIFVNYGHTQQLSDDQKKPLKVGGRSVMLTPGTAKRGAPPPFNGLLNLFLSFYCYKLAFGGWGRTQVLMSLVPRVIALPTIKQLKGFSVQVLNNLVVFPR